MTLTKIMASVATKIQAVGDVERDGQYEGGDFVMKREHGTTPMGNKLGGKWVLRTVDGEWLDFDANRADLAERFNLRFAADY